MIKLIFDLIRFRFVGMGVVLVGEIEPQIQFRTVNMIDNAAKLRYGYYFAVVVFSGSVIAHTP